MDFLQAVFLSIIEGITEFLPISSTGHLILTSNLLQIPETEFVKSFAIIIQLGAIFAVVFLYWKTLIQSFNIWKNIIIAFIPTGVLGLTLYKLIKDTLLGSPLIVVVSLFIGGVILIIFEKTFEEKSYHLENIERLSLKQALIIGLIQSISMIPGVSRSASTIIGGLLVGMKRKTAVEFSFLLAIPTMFAATGLDLIKTHFKFSSSEYLILVIGLVGAFVTATLAIKFFVKFVQTHTLTSFGIYRIVIAILYWLIILPK